MKNRIEMALEGDTLLARSVEWWLARCDFVLGRRDEAMAFCWVVERVLLFLAALWWLWVQIPQMYGGILAGIVLLPVAVLTRAKCGR